MIRMVHFEPAESAGFFNGEMATHTNLGIGHYQRLTTMRPIMYKLTKFLNFNIIGKI